MPKHRNSSPHSCCIGNSCGTAAGKSTYPQGEFLINNTKVVVLNAGASLAEVASKYNIPLNRLYAMNDFGSTAEKVQKATLVFLQLKRTVCEKAYHEVVAGENIYDIAQAEGIRLESLLKLNNLGKYDTPAAGTKLKLHDDSASFAKINGFSICIPFRFTIKHLPPI
ncbi:LysM peptidoglycan-binding domain-containing protein [Niabella defluvii]|nr:LysM peptidoglycan-binding domain-containing protein [Niabella sp. I65]